MNFSKTFVKRPVTTLMIILVVILLGSVSFSQIPVDLYPDMEIPVALVMVNYPNTAPEEVENLVTKPIEQQVATVENLKAITSNSSEGSAIIIAEFEYGTDMDFASLEMREKVAIISDFLPEDSTDPMIFKLDPAMMPIMDISVSSEMPLDELHALVDEEINSKIERIGGVASAYIYGGLEKEIQIVFNQEMLSGYNLSLSTISQKLSGENINLPSGNIDKGSQDILVRTIGEFTSVKDIKDIPISLPTGEVVLLSSIATVTEGFDEQSSISRVNGSPSIGISISKQSTANTVNTAGKVMDTLTELEKQYPEVKFTVGFNQADFINNSISNVSRTMILGGSLAVVVLFIFLRSLKSTMIIALAIPISIIATFALMFFNDLTINVISLGGLALGVGMLVDNSIVVLENIYRLREEGLSRFDASVKGASEVTSAILASTLTTVAVFLPVIFVQGFTAIMFKELSLTVTFALLASFGVAISVVPMLSSKFLDIHRPSDMQAKKTTLRSKLSIIPFFTRAIDGLTIRYTSALTKALEMRKRIVVGVIILFVASLGSIALVGGELFPSADEGTFTVSVTTPYGTSLKDRDQFIYELEDSIATIPEVKNYTVSIGGDNFFSQTGANTSTIRVELVEKSMRQKSTDDLVIQVRDAFKNVPGAEIKVDASSNAMGPTGSGAPIQIKLQGDNLDTLKTITSDTEDLIRKIPGISEVTSDLEDGNPELRVFIDRQKAAQYGISTYQLAKTLESSISGSTATKLKIDGEEIDIKLSLNESVKSSVENMKQILIQSPTGQFVSVSEIASLKYGNSPATITREDQVRTVTISAKISGRDLQSISNDISKTLDQRPLPFGYSFEFGGQQKDMIEAFSSLGLALILSVLLVYMVLASLFESLLQPFIIMMSVPFAFTGAFLGLFLTGTPLSLPAFIGLIVLSGIVVNNAIVLIDYINQQRKAGVPRKEAIIDAGRHRLRPILMTMLTTVLGLFPLALGLGEGTELQSPMGISVIGGLLFSTTITLIFVPIIYSLIDDFATKVKKRFQRKKNIENQITPEVE